MLLVVSDSAEFGKKLYDRLLPKGLPALFVTFENVDDFVGSDTDFTDIVIIDGRHSQKNARCAQMLLVRRFPHADIKMLTLDSQLTALFDSLSSERDKYISFGCLRLSPSDTEAWLLGYPLRLTKSEHKILLLLSSEPERSFSADCILRIAFPFSFDLSKNQLAVHICNINKKARRITGRKLITNPHKIGYMLNPHL